MKLTSLVHMTAREDDIDQYHRKSVVGCTERNECRVGRQVPLFIPLVGQGDAILTVLIRHLLFMRLISPVETLTILIHVQHGDIAVTKDPKIISAVLQRLQ